MNWWSTTVCTPFLLELILSLPYYFPALDSVYFCLCALYLTQSPPFPLTYCVCPSSLAVAEGWRGHRHSRWQYIGRRKRPHSSGAWVRWGWKGGMMAWEAAHLLTGCHIGKDSVHKAPWIPHRGRAMSGCCVASSGGGQVVRWCGTTVRGWFGWVEGSSTLAAAGVEERWSGDVRDAVRGLGRRTRCETRVKGSGILRRVLGVGYPRLTGPDGGSRNLGRRSLCCLRR